MDGFVYWTDASRLWRIPMDGGFAEPVLPEEFVHFVAFDGQELFMKLDRQGLCVWSPSIGAVPRPNARVPLSTSFQVVGGDVYWLDSRGLMRARREGGPPENVETMARSAFAIEGDARWWEEGETDESRLLKQRVGSGESVVVTHAPRDPTFVACDGALYWVDGPWENPRSGRLVRNRAGTSQVDILTTVRTGTLSCGEHRVYWVEEWSSGEGEGSLIRSLRTDGSAPIDLVSVPDQFVHTLAVRGARLYWVARNFGRRGEWRGSIVSWVPAE